MVNQYLSVGKGIVRCCLHRGQIFLTVEPDDPARCAVQQLELLAEAAKLVVVGGLLVYSVCSIEVEETTEVTDQFLESHPGFRQEPVTTLPAAARDAEGRLMLLPGQFGSDGVYGVRFRRMH